MRLQQRAVCIYVAALVLKQFSLFHELLLVDGLTQLDPPGQYAYIQQASSRLVYSARRTSATVCYLLSTSVIATNGLRAA